MAIGAGLGLMILPWFIKIPGITLGLIICGIILCTQAALVIILHKKDSIAKTAKIQILCTILFLLIFELIVIPAIESIKISPAITDIIKQHSNETTPIATFGYEEPTLNFYINKHLKHLQNTEQLNTWLETQKAGLLIISKSKLNCLKEKTRKYQSISTVKGINYTKGKPMQVQVIQIIPKK
jgi:D-alanyl-lipoteichoic acid acyltransferase DltB (MBOAT superfamily)